MIDISNIKYRVIVVDSKKNRYNITDYLENLGWQENEGEISMQISFTVRNDKSSKGYLSKLIRPGTLVIVSAKHDSKKYKEVARGCVVTWNPTNQNSSRNLKSTCYDELYNLQKSQDDFYFRSGTGTKTRIQKVLKKWKVPMGAYCGPNKKHSKKKYQGKYLSDILLDILDDAVKKGGKKCILQMEKGKVTVVPRGSNDEVFVFKANNTKVVSNSRSTANMVTRVKVIGKSKKKGKKKVIATLNGHTKYGVRQRIYTRGSDESLKQAKKAAQEILDESGDIKHDITVQCPDVPYIRKGDMVYMGVGSVRGYYYVKGIQHDADTTSMTMSIEPSGKKSGSKSGSSDSHMIGDVVNFTGGTHYVSSSSSKGYPAKAGQAKITKKNADGKHPYHLIHTDSKSNVYGWVNEDTIR